MASANVEVLAPRELIIPSISGGHLAQPHRLGALFISGAKLLFYNGTNFELITSA